MRSTALILSLIALGATQAMAQEVPYSRTLDEQLQRIKQGKPPVPQAQEAAAPQAAEVPAAAETPAASEPARKPFVTTPADQTAPAMAAPSAGDMPVAAPIVYRDRKGEVIDSLGGDAIPALPLSVVVSGETRYITGGVGDEEMAQLRSVENEYNFRLLIAGNAGEYIGEASVRISDSAGTQLMTADDAGPYFYTMLKPGKYTVEVATQQSGTKSASVTVPESGFVKPVMRF